MSGTAVRSPLLDRRLYVSSLALDARPHLMTTARRRPKRRGTDARTALRNVRCADIDDEQLERLAATVERRVPR